MLTHIFKKHYIPNAYLKGGQPSPNMDNLLLKNQVNFRFKSEVVCDENDEDIVLFKQNN